MFLFHFSPVLLSACAAFYLTEKRTAEQQSVAQFLRELIRRSVQPHWQQLLINLTDQSLSRQHCFAVHVGLSVQV